MRDEVLKATGNVVLNVTEGVSFPGSLLIGLAAAGKSFEYDNDKKEITILNAKAGAIQDYIRNCFPAFAGYIRVSESLKNLELYEVEYGNDAWTDTVAVWAYSEEEARAVTFAELRKNIVIKSIRKI